MARIWLKRKFDKYVTEDDVRRILKELGCEVIASGFTTGYGGYIVAECTTPSGRKVIKHFAPIVTTRKIEQELILYELTEGEMKELEKYRP